MNNEREVFIKSDNIFSDIKFLVSASDIKSWKKEYKYVYVSYINDEARVAFNFIDLNKEKKYTKVALCTDGKRLHAIEIKEDELEEGHYKIIINSNNRVVVLQKDDSSILNLYWFKVIKNTSSYVLHNILLDNRTAINDISQFYYKILKYTNLSTPINIEYLKPLLNRVWNLYIDKGSLNSEIQKSSTIRFEVITHYQKDDRKKLAIIATIYYWDEE